MTATAAQAALEPVRQRLRRDAQEQAARLRAAAREQAAAIVRRAREDAAAELGKSAADAAAVAAPVTAAELRRARDAARAAVLAAQRQAYEDMRMRVRDAVSSLPDQPGYDRLIQRITRLAVQAAGPSTQLESPPGGGVVARSDGMIVDCSLARLADLAMAELGGAIRELWAP
jgi:vacuolar-type H+-ATPase subunit E/Vma4